MLEAYRHRPLVADDRELFGRESFDKPPAALNWIHAGTSAQATLEPPSSTARMNVVVSIQQLHVLYNPATPADTPANVTLD
jgi:hypothetical protein